MTISVPEVPGPQRSSKTTDDLRLALRAASMYHVEGATQAEIAAKLGVSRPTAGRLVAKARALGLVTIEINVPDELQGTVHADIERDLERTFGLTEALVVPDVIDGTDRGYGSLGRAAAAVLSRRLASTDTLGFTWGPETVAVAHSLKSRGAKCAQVVQLDGSMSSADYQTGVEYTLGRCAEYLQARPVRLNAPLYADPATVTALQQDSVISRALQAGTEAEAMMYGLGPVSTSTTLFEGSFIDLEIIDELRNLGAVGEIGGRFFDIDGTPTGGSLPDRTVSVGLDAIRSCDRAILISGGVKKHQAILGALRGGFASVLVTDIESARWLMAHTTEGVSQ
ncbi:MarR family transcriptional regulator [Rhodococcus sp. 15-649-1-2]|nr:MULTISPECIES: sugar-binding transcriptional regulator [Rhodococcus]OZE83668.1 MarR family transcriptional regulator [Rhodococcus sp. 15-649-1-2]OZF03345.1 MarR family transcriptional regulator [Rhodococcus sp. 15-1189-1-1a]OZF17148.1 MarR family transcriptional regulator [Rhodococcus sp. 14-2686-1-2]